MSDNEYDEQNDAVDDLIDTNSFKKISTDEDIICDSSRTYCPRHTRNGKALHGIYTTTEDELETLVYINKGNVMSYYCYPVIDRYFESPMVNHENLHLCGGWFWEYTDEMPENDRLLSRVVNNQKPVCSIYSTDDKLTTLRYNANNHKYLGAMYRKGKWRFNELIVFQKETFDNLFDLESLEIDYNAYMRAANRSDKPINFDYLYGKTFIDFSKVNLDWDCEYGVEFVGLVFGFPIETTVSRKWFV